MKALPVALLFLFSSSTFAQVNCTTYLGGVTSCSGPNGYQSESRQGLNGQSSFYDSYGNSGTVTRTLNGGVNVSPSQIGGRVPGGAAPRVSSDGRYLGFATGETLTASPNMGVVDSSELPVVDLSKLPKTPEEYRLAMLWMKAVEARDFDKAIELKQLLWKEQFKNATTAGRVHMFNEERAAKRLSMMRSLDVVEQRIKWENRPARLALFHKFKEKTLILFEEQEAMKDKAFQEAVKEWKDEDEGNARFAKLEADMAALKAADLDPLEYQKKQDELLKQWGKTEGEQKQRKSATVDAEIEHMLVEQKAQRKITNKKVSVR